MKKPIRVLHILTRMNRSGAETMIMNYYRKIDKSKVQFDFLVHRKDQGDYDEEIINMGGRIYKLNPINYFHIKSYEKELNNFFKIHKYLIVHSHLNATSYYVSKIASKNKIKVIIAHSHTNLSNFSFWDVLYKNISFNEYFKIRYKNYLRKKIHKYITHFFACEKDAAIWLFGKEKLDDVIILKNAINSKEYIFNQALSTKMKKELDIADKTLVFGHVGSFYSVKNHSFLIDIFFNIYQLNKDVLLLLIGDGHLMNSIIKKVNELGLSNNVKFMGKKENVSDYLQIMNGFIMPSLHEGLPVTLVEAQAAGIKCFVSDSIDKNIDITGLVNFISLNKSATFWAKTILNNVNYNKTNMYNLILKNNYDINENAIKLQEFYIKSINS